MPLKLLDPKDVKNFFFRIPHKDFLWWRSEEDYVCEFVDYLYDRRGISFPEHTLLFSRVSIYTLITECRLIFTRGDVDVFMNTYKLDTSLEMDDVETRDLKDIRKRYNEYWNNGAN